MNDAPQTPRVQPGGLVTVAFLKAQLDAGSDHLGIFMPLIYDIVARLPSSSFTAPDVQEAMAAQHGIAMPQHAVATLLRRATKKGYLARASGRYQRSTAPLVPRTDVASDKRTIQLGQTRLGEALREHAARRRFALASPEAALDTLFRFLNQEQIALLLGTPAPVGDTADATLHERALVAEFINLVVKDDPALRAVLRNILEGMVLYHAAFLPDLTSHIRSFRDLLVAFDSVLVRQTLGYEGVAMRALLRETVTVLSGAGITCVVFDVTIDEIKRILSMYEHRLATEAGRRSLRPVPMARHFLTQHYSPGDVREMAALLERDVGAGGFQIRPTPPRVREHTAAERALAQRLADPHTKDELEPRVQHDVDCVAAILTLRHGRSSAAIEDANAVFATSSSLVIHNTRRWYHEDEHRTGVEPIVHIRALANLAWLKKPALCVDLKERELVALCAAALRPRQETWLRFLHHLENQEHSHRLTSDEVTAIVASAMSDQLLREAEEENANDIDAVTLDEIVDRVKQTYAANAADAIRSVKRQYDEELQAFANRERDASSRAEESTKESERARQSLRQYEARLAEALERERRARAEAEVNRQRELLHEQRARNYARRVSWLLYALASVVVLGGGVALILGHPLHAGWLGVTLGAAVVVFVSLEGLGILRHLRERRLLLEAHLTKRLRGWLSAEDNVHGDASTPHSSDSESLH